MNVQRQQIIAIMRDLNAAAMSLNVALVDAADAILGPVPWSPVAVRQS